MVEQSSDLRVLMFGYGWIAYETRRPEVFGLGDTREAAVELLRRRQAAAQERAVTPLAPSE